MPAMLGAVVNVAAKSFQWAFETLVFYKRCATDVTKAQYITLISTYTMPVTGEELLRLITDAFS